MWNQCTNIHRSEHSGTGRATSLHFLIGTGTGQTKTIHNNLNGILERNFNFNTSLVELTVWLMPPPAVWTSAYDAPANFSFISWHLRGQGLIHTRGKLKRHMHVH